MDLVAGLHWLRENLPAFGGDPERITLMGHGTGAALTNIIAVSPVAKGIPVLDLFQTFTYQANFLLNFYSFLSLSFSFLSFYTYF